MFFQKINGVLHYRYHRIARNRSWLLVIFPRHKNNVVEIICCTAATSKTWQFLAVRRSAELRLYRSSLPRLIIVRTIWSEWTQPRWSPFLAAGCPSSAKEEPVISQLLSWRYHCNYGIWLVLLWRLHMRPHGGGGNSIILQRVRSEPGRIQ